jgi:hypothetical protein
MAHQQTKQETKQDRAADFWQQRIDAGQAQQMATQQQRQKERQQDKPKQQKG